MDNMDYEQKYKEALNEAIAAYKDEDKHLKATLERIFPELKDEMDELTWLINYISEEAYGLSMDIRDNEDRIKLKKLQRSVAWLKKQGKQKELNLVEILKHYPRETELYSPLYGKLWLAEVDEENEIITCYKYPLDEGCTRAILEQENTISFYSNGTTGLPDCTISKDCMLFLYNKNQSGQKPVDKIQIGKEYKCIASPRYSAFIRGKIYKPKDKFLCDFMNFCSDCFKLIEDSEQIDLTSNTDKVEPKFNEGDTIVEKDFFECDYETIKEIKDGKYIFTDGSTMNINEQDGWLLVKPK